MGRGCCATLTVDYLMRTGSQVEVAWGPRYNHGGGYSYVRPRPTFLYPRSLADRSMRVCPRLQRLCKADKELTEECFQQTPLAFDKTKQTLVWSTLRSLLHSFLVQTFLLKRHWLRTDTKEVPVKADGASKVPPIPKNGTLRFPVPNPVFVTEGTWPKGSMWARDPVSSREARHPISRL